jgi:predicted metal-dependent enzyme (double-stranded beta helix superfamily)
VEAAITMDLERLIQDCRSMLTLQDPARSVHHVVAMAVSTPAAVTAMLGTPARGGMHTIHHSHDLTILNIVWAPGMAIMPHDHRMWSVIGIYGGCEDNLFWRRVPHDRHGRIEPTDVRTLSQGEAVVLAADVIHSVRSPASGFTAAIHVYGGDFFGARRSEWDLDSLSERPFDAEHARRLFERAT